MSKRYVWMKDNNDDIADQLVLISGNMALEPFKTMLTIAPTTAEMALRLALANRYVQKDLLVASRSYAGAVAKARDLLEVDATPEPFMLPPVNWPALPTMPDGSDVFDTTIMTDIYAWFDAIIRQWKANPLFTGALQTQMGLVVPPAGSHAPTTAGPQIRQVKVLPGGVLQLDVFRGGHPLVLVEAKIDDGEWTLMATSAASRVTIQVPAGAAHSVQLRSRFAKRDGTPIGDYSAIVTVSSLP